MVLLVLGYGLVDDVAVGGVEVEEGVADGCFEFVGVVKVYVAAGLVP